MSDTQTLNSRLRLLVVKSFRAEKLYTSLRNSDGAKLSSVSSLADIANDVRAREWQKCYTDLRSSLNDILSLGSNMRMSKEVLALREHFRQQFLADRDAIESGVESIRETANREEFAHLLKASVEMIRVKARMQASKAILDELTVLLQSSGHLDQSNREEGVFLPAAAAQLEPADSEIETRVPQRVGSNVVLLRRKVL